MVRERNCQAPANPAQDKNAREMPIIKVLGRITNLFFIIASKISQLARILNSLKLETSLYNT